MFNIKRNLGKIIIILLILLIIIHIFTDNDNEKEQFEVTTSSFSWLYNLPGMGWIKTWIDFLSIFSFIKYIPGGVGDVSYGSTICCSLILPLLIFFGSIASIIKSASGKK